VEPEAADDLAGWQEELKVLQNLRPMEALRNQMRIKEIPDLEEQIKKHEGSLPRLSSDAEEVISAPSLILAPLISYRHKRVWKR
jgi:hypothetical protein